MADLYNGYAPSNVSKDAKYSIKHGLDGKMQVHLVYRFNHRDYALLSTELHPDLVDMVNDIKLEVQGVFGGVFYINEFGHVLVKAADRGCYYAGDYDDPVIFEFEDESIGPEPGPGIAPGELWPGPHVGIRYTLTAGSDDIYYEREVRPRFFQRTFLSDIDEVGANRLARRLAKVKGSSGGRVYINEASCFFAPVDDGDGLQYVYLGDLGTDVWFPEPSPTSQT